MQNILCICKMNYTDFYTAYWRSDVEKEEI